MKVTCNTDTRLIVEDRPWFLGAMLIAFTLALIAEALRRAADNPILALLLAGVAALVAAAAWRGVHLARMTFDRGNGTVELRRRSLTGDTVQRFALADVAVARVQTLRNDQGESFRVALVVAGRSEPLTLSYSGGDGPARVVEAVNRWLASEHAADPPSA